MAVHKTAAAYKQKKEAYIFEKLSALSTSTNALTGCLFLFYSFFLFALLQLFLSFLSIPKEGWYP